MEATIERLAATSRAQAQILPEKLNAFAALMRSKLDTGDTQASKACLRSVISRIEAYDQKLRIIGDKGVLAGRQTQTGNVRGFVRKWRSVRESNPPLPRERRLS